jgi:hypothetical protein
MRRIALTARVALPVLAAAVVGTAIAAVPHATAHPAAAPSATTDAASSPQSVTLLWIDPATGTVTTSWSGTPEQAAVLYPDTLYDPSSGGTLETGQTSQKSGTISPLIVQRTCSLPNSYFDVRASSLHCYAYAGDINTYITYTYEVDAGNNVAYFKYLYGGVYHQISLARWTSAVFSSRVTVTHIHIY